MAEKTSTPQALALPPAIEQQLKQLPAVAANIKEFREFLKAGVDTATGYGKAVLGLGYIGFFTLWAGTRSQVGAHFPRLVLWSALAMGLSLFFYMLFEVAQSAVISFAYFGMVERLNVQPLNVALYGFKTDISNRYVKLLAVWRLVFLVCVALGFGGAATLIVGWIRTLAV